MGGLRRLTAWAAAYALVLQLVLPGVLVSLQASAAGGYQLCSGTDPAAHGQGSGGEPAVHCPLCLFRTDAIALPPPEPRLFQERVAVLFHYGVAASPSGIGKRPAPAHQPRAPPFMA